VSEGRASVLGLSPFVARDYDYAMRLPFLAAPVAAAVLASAGSAKADDWFGKDKTLHFGVSVGLAAGGYAAGTQLFETRRSALILGGSFSIALGAGKEIYDATGHGDPSWKDFTWDLIGTAVGLGLAYGVHSLAFPREKAAY
jgi:putative lipoprotein